MVIATLVLFILKHCKDSLSSFYCFKSFTSCWIYFTYSIAWVRTVPLSVFHNPGIRAERAVNILVILPSFSLSHYATICLRRGSTPLEEFSIAWILLGFLWMLFTMIILACFLGNYIWHWSGILKRQNVRHWLWTIMWFETCGLVIWWKSLIPSKEKEFPMLFLTRVVLSVEWYE